jgi:hypothetical protein
VIGEANINIPRLFLDVLPKIASHPMAIVAYICVGAGWLLFALRQQRSRDFIKALESLPKEKRIQFCRDAGYSYDELATLQCNALSCNMLGASSETR